MSMKMVEQLSQQHGRFAQYDFAFFFEDGFAVKFSSNRGDYFQQYEVPTDELERAKARLQFFQCSLRNEEEEFTRYKQDCLNQVAMHNNYPKTCPSPHPGVVEQLKVGQAKVEEWRTAVAELEAEIAELVESRLPARQRQLREQLGTQEQTNHVEHLTREIESISI